MDTLLSNIEERRGELQEGLDSSKTRSERNVLGQFSTPFSFAKAILEESKKYFDKIRTVSFLDPAFGTGVFYSTLMQTFPKEAVSKASGIEVDLRYAEPIKEIWQRFPLEIRIADFMSLAPPDAQSEKYNLIVCNPPYTRHHHIPKAQKQSLQQWVKNNFGYRISGLSGLYCYFMLCSDKWLSDKGLACWLIPSEFMDVNYGKTLKRYLTEKVTLLRIHRFHPEDVQFDDALVTSVVVWFTKARTTEEGQVIFSYGTSLASPEGQRSVELVKMEPSEKWSNYFSNKEKLEKCTLTLGDYFHIKRGVATGDNKFFILSEGERKERNIPLQFLYPILPSPRYLKEDIIESHTNGLPDIEKPLFLLDCDLDEEEIKQKYPHLWTYLSQGIGSVSERYICRHRTPWYRQEKRSPAAFLCTYMGRNRNSRRKPFRFILNKSKAVAANVYLLLYPKPLLARVIANDSAIRESVLDVLNSIDIELLVRAGRVYGGGLHKLEPKELENLPLAGFGDIAPELRIRKIVQGSLF